MTLQDVLMEVRADRSIASRAALRLVVLGAIVVALGSAATSIAAGSVSADIVGVLGLLGFSSVGAIILDRRPGEPVGRICLALGILYGIAVILRAAVGSVEDVTGTVPPAIASIAVISST